MGLKPPTRWAKDEVWKSMVDYGITMVLTMRNHQWPWFTYHKIFFVLYKYKWMLSGWSSARVSSNLNPNPIGFLFHPWECGGTKGPETKHLPTKFHSPSQESLGVMEQLGLCFLFFFKEKRQTADVLDMFPDFFWAISWYLLPFNGPEWNPGVVGFSMMQKWIRRRFVWMDGKLLGFFWDLWVSGKVMGGRYPHFHELRS